MYMRLYFLFFLALILSAVSCGRKGSPAADQKASTLDAQRQKIIHVAKSKIGTPYKMGARGPRRFDCSGFTQYVYEAAGIQLPRTARAQSVLGKEVKVSKIQAGDLVVFKRGRKVQHVGICVRMERGQVWVVHATSSKGVILENVSSSVYWKNRLRSGRVVVR